MNDRRTFVLPYVNEVTVIFNSSLAKKVAGLTASKEVNLCMVLNGREIHAQRDYIHRITLAHECGHIISARKRGDFLYKLWAAIAWIKDKYSGSKAEHEGDDHMNQHKNEYPTIYIDGTMQYA